MQIIKSLHAGILHRTFDYHGKNICGVTTLWGFKLTSGEPVLEQALWQAVAKSLGPGEMLDMGIPKDRGEYVVHGSYFAPDAKPVVKDTVSVRLGSQIKQLAIFGNRYWNNGLGGYVLDGPEAFTEMPINFANAFGGKGYKKNESGKGYNGTQEGDDPRRPLPNIEYPDQLIKSPDDRPEPAGFGRIDVMSESRNKRKGTYDDRYIQERMPGFPDDIDWLFFNETSSDQWHEGVYAGSETFEIHHMHPEYSVIKGRLPGVYGRAFIQQRVDEDLKFKEIPLQLDTVWFFPNDDLGVVLHRGSVGVATDDATDIEALMIANENLQNSPRSQAHYEEAMGLRMDREESFKYLMYTQPLIPKGCQCGFDSMKGGKDNESLMNQNMQAYGQRKQDELNADIDAKLAQNKAHLATVLQGEESAVKAQLEKLDLNKPAGEQDPDVKILEALIEKILPGARDNNIDLTKLNLKAMDELNAKVRAMADEKQQEMEASLKQQIEDAKKQFAGQPDSESVIADMQRTIDDMQRPPPLPRFNDEAMKAQYEQQIAQSRFTLDQQMEQISKTGDHTAELEQLKQARERLGEFDEIMDGGHDKAREGYRQGAHYMDTCRSPHEGKEAAIREAFLQAVKNGEPVANGDYAFLDLSHQDLSGLDLSGAYFEYADLSQANFSGANLSGAVFANARLHGVDFSQCNLAKANLGACDIYQSRFVEADLTEAILSKSIIKESCFHRCRIMDGLDTFMETEFEQVDFSGSEMRQLNFLKLRFNHCCFNHTDLSQSVFYEIEFVDTSFAEACLTETIFVFITADKANFNNARMHNARFVGGCSLIDSSYLEAQATEVNFRECDLHSAEFTGADISKSDFGSADLSAANLHSVTAVQTQFMGAKLVNTCFDYSNLMESALYKSELQSASFKFANLYAANLLSSTLGNTDFTGALLDQTILKDWRPLVR